MAVSTFDELIAHAGHMLACITYGRSPTEIANVAIECEDCYVVLMDFDHPDMIEARRETEGGLDD